jgi:Fic family protein
VTSLISSNIISTASKKLLTIFSNIWKENKKAVSSPGNHKEIGDLTFRQAEILKQFLKQPEKSVTISEIVTTFNVAYATARSNLFHLEKLGYVEKRKVGKEFIFIFKRNYGGFRIALNR